MKYYCIGIKGAGMSTLAQILFDLGNEVSGYDDNSNYKFTQEGLDSRGIKIYYDNKGSNIQYTTDDNEERLKELLPELIRGKIPIVVNTDKGFAVLNPEKVALIEAKELENAK